MVLRRLIPHCLHCRGFGGGQPSRPGSDRWALLLVCRRRASDARGP